MTCVALERNPLDTIAARAQHRAMNLKSTLQIIGWANRELARRYGVSENQVRRWKAGATIPADLAECLTALEYAHKKNPIPSKEKH